MKEVAAELWNTAALYNLRPFLKVVVLPKLATELKVVQNNVLLAQSRAVA